MHTQIPGRLPVQTARQIDPIHKSIQFGETLKEKIVSYEATIPDLLERQESKQTTEILNTAQKLRHALEHPEQLYTTKPPGQNIFFSTRNPAGWVIRGSEAAGSERPEGLFSYDMQHLDHLVLHPENQMPLHLLHQRKLNNPFQQEVGMEAQYEVPGNSGLQVFRKHQMDHNGQLKETFVFRNTGPTQQVFYLDAGSKGLDIFQARSLSNESDKNALLTNIQYSARQQEANSIELAATHQATKNHQPLNPIRTYLSPSGQYDEFKLLDENTARLKVTVPSGAETKTQLTIKPFNSRFPSSSGMPEKYIRTWDSLKPSIKISLTNENLDHLSRMWEVAIDDLRTLTIPVQCGKTTFYPCAAGIPNYVALFGRDSIITALQTLQLNPMLARDTLATLSYYQGQKKDAFTEEESGKIFHELRSGETTRLGLSPHKPYYGSIDATPLFVILYNQYLARTSDKTFSRVVWPNVEKAIQWIDKQMVTDPKHPLYGFLIQRDKDQNEATGATGLKNIGWKDSDGATRHLVKNKNGQLLTPSPDGNYRDENSQILITPQGTLTPAGTKAKLTLTQPQYPLALAEVQAYVYGAWQAASDCYSRKAQMAFNPIDKLRFESKAKHYQTKAADLKERFNQRFWLPNENFIAMAIQGNGKPLSSLSSNGAQSLMTGIVDKEKAQKMATRLMQPDLISGWGVRTLSSNSFAYDPFAYHNGTIWAHDNSLIVMGLTRYGLKDAANSVSLATQLIEAGRTFEHHRLPELYSGLPRKADDTKIPAYPNTCVPQAWASGSLPLILTSLLGLEVHEKSQEIILQNPVLPAGVSSLELTLGVVPEKVREAMLEPDENKIQTIDALNPDLHTNKPMLAGRQATIRIHQKQDGTYQVDQISGAPDVKVRVTSSPSSTRSPRTESKARLL